MNFFKWIWSKFSRKPVRVVTISATIHPKPEEKIVSEAKQIIPKEPERKPDPVRSKPRKPGRKWQMRNNRLHIVLSGHIESMRCTKLERAEQITKRFSGSVIQKAIFQDKNGNQFTIA